MSVCDRGDLGTRAARTRNQFVQARTACCDDGIVMLRCAKAIARAQLSRPTLRSPRSNTRLVGPCESRADARTSNFPCSPGPRPALPTLPVSISPPSFFESCVAARWCHCLPCCWCRCSLNLRRRVAAHLQRWGFGALEVGARHLHEPLRQPPKLSSPAEKDAKFEFSTVTHLMRSNKWSELFEFGSRRSRSFLCIPHHESSSARGMRAVCAHQRRERHRQRARTVCARTPKGQINASHIPSDVSLRVQNTTDCAKFKRVCALFSGALSSLCACGTVRSAIL
jgi:hypothetical protein